MSSGAVRYENVLWDVGLPYGDWGERGLMLAAGGFPPFSQAVLTSAVPSGAPGESPQVAFGPECGKLKMGTVGLWFAVRRKETRVTSAKEILVKEIGRLSESDAQEVLELLRTKKTATVTPARSKLTRDELLRRAAGHPGIHAPDPLTR
jgi:hypothetical protein